MSYVDPNTGQRKSLRIQERSRSTSVRNSDSEHDNDEVEVPVQDPVDVIDDKPANEKVVQKEEKNIQEIVNEDVEEPAKENVEEPVNNDVKKQNDENVEEPVQDNVEEPAEDDVDIEDQKIEIDPQQKDVDEHVLEIEPEEIKTYEDIPTTDETQETSDKTPQEMIKIAKKRGKSRRPSHKNASGEMEEYDVIKFKSIDFQQFGVGIYLYFKFLKQLSKLFLFLFVLSVPLSLSCISSHSTLEKTPMMFEQTTIGNLGDR